MTGPTDGTAIAVETVTDPSGTNEAADWGAGWRTGCRPTATGTGRTVWAGIEVTDCEALGARLDKVPRLGEGARLGEGVRLNDSFQPLALRNLLFLRGGSASSLRQHALYPRHGCLPGSPGVFFFKNENILSNCWFRTLEL